MSACAISPTVLAPQLRIELRDELRGRCAGPDLPAALPATPSAADAAAYLRGRVGEPAALAEAYARRMQYQERLFWAARDNDHEASLAACDARRGESVTLIDAHNAAAQRLTDGAVR